MWPLNTCVTSICAVSMHIFLLTIFSMFKNVCPACVNLCTLWMHYLSWDPSILKQRCIISESNEPQWVPVEFLLSLQALPQCGIVLEILPGKLSQWDNVPFSVCGTLCFYHIQTLLQIQEGRCGTTGSRWRVYLHLYPTLPWIWKEGSFSLEALEPQHQLFESLFQRNLKTAL